MALLVLLVGTFRPGIFEVAHSLSHYFTDGHGHHSHHASSGGESDHEHVILDISQKAFEVHDDAPIVPDDRLEFSYDRILHVFVPPAWKIMSVEWDNKKIPLFDLELPTTPVMQTATPPPDFIA